MQPWFEELSTLGVEGLMDWQPWYKIVQRDVGGHSIRTLTPGQACGSRCTQPPTASRSSRYGSLCHRDKCVISVQNPKPYPRVLLRNLGERQVCAIKNSGGSVDWSEFVETDANSFKDEFPNSEYSATLERTFNRRMSSAIRERSLLRPGEKILIAVSGGQDSVCLLKTLANLQKQWNWRIGVVHCDHQWSPSSKNQGSHVAQIAASLNLSYYQAVTTTPVPGESLARTWRYGIIQRIALRHGYTSIITAHTASDRVETLLYNLFRGSGLHGLQSLTWKRMLSPSLSLSYRAAFTPAKIISSLETYDGHSNINIIHVDDPSQVSLVRPFLGFTRTEIREFCAVLDVPLWPDPSNMSLDIDRNRIRHQLLPYLRENFQDSVDKSLARCAEILHSEQAYLDSVCGSILRKAETVDKDERKLDVQIVQSLPVALQRRVLKQFVENFTGRSLGFDHIERLRASISLSADTQPYGLNIPLPGGASVRLLQTHFCLSRPKP